jgi:Rieske Fe-S protein
MKMEIKTQKQDVCESSTNKTCAGRREFLVTASALAGGLALTLSGVTGTKALNNNENGNNPAEDLVLKLDTNSPLNKVGGSQTVDSTQGKIIVIRNSETSYKAFSAVCTHKGGTLGYDEKSQQLACPNHGSRFDLEGKVAKGPAKTPVSGFITQSAILINVK